MSLRAAAVVVELATEAFPDFSSSHQYHRDAHSRVNPGTPMSTRPSKLGHPISLWLAAIVYPPIARLVTSASARECPAAIMRLATITPVIIPSVKITTDRTSKKGGLLLGGVEAGCGESVATENLLTGPCSCCRFLICRGLAGTHSLSWVNRARGGGGAECLA